MKRAQYQAWLLGVTLLSLLCLTPVSATSPTLVIVYGDSVPSPIVIRCQPGGESVEFLWNTIRGGSYVKNGTLQRGTIPNGLSGRPYLKVAIFWPLYDPTAKPAKPEDASQHVRLYLPTASEPAVVVATPIARDHEFSPQPIPEDLSGFLAGWVLNAKDLAIAKRLGFPGL